MYHRSVSAALAKAALTVLTGVAFVAVSVHAAPIVVDPNATPCVVPSVHFTTVQAAVNAAPSGATVQVCPGSYPEQVTITQPLTLKGALTSGVATIVMPIAGFVNNANGNSVPAQLLVQPNTGPVTIRNLTLDGTVPVGYPVLSIGIVYDTTPGVINGVVVKNQDIGILVQTDTTGVNVTVQNSSIYAYDHWGILGTGAGLYLVAQNNYLKGPRGTAITTPAPGYETDFSSGIAITGGTGTISGNTVTYNLEEFCACHGGIHVETSNVTVNDNTVAYNDFGILLRGGVSNNVVQGNSVVGNFSGISVCDSNGNFIQNNTLISNIDSIMLNSSGLACAVSYNNSVTGNKINDGGGISGALPFAGNSITGNTLFNVE